MPRLAGQIDVAKSEAILAAAGDAIYEEGLGVSVAAIARRAGVSKQTIYNRFGCKADLVRALVEKRVELITAPLDVADAADFPQQALEGYARVLLQTISDPRSLALMRLIIESAGANPDLARRVFEAGPAGSRAKLAWFLEREARAGRIAVDHPGQAADFFAGMVVSHHQLAGLLGLPVGLPAARIERIAKEAARRFMKAYAPG